MSCSARAKRAANRLHLEEQNLHVPPAVEEEVVTCAHEVHQGEAAAVDGENVSVETQCTLLADFNSRFCVEMFVNNKRAIEYYTGFQDYDHFKLFFNILGPAVNHLNYQCKLLSPENHLFLTMLKLRQAKEDIELSILFKISPATVSTIIITWINFMFFQLGELDFWPGREIIEQHMPQNCKAQFPKTRVILDATETPINKPSLVDDQSVTFSTYKNRNTLKTVIGCSPRGLVTYISNSYGGSASDRQIIERSELCTKPSMFQRGDSIMADRGIMVQDLFANKHVQVNTPSMLKGKPQLDAVTVVRDRRIASKRIHIETYSRIHHSLNLKQRIAIYY